MQREQLVQCISNINEHNFEEVALSLFHYQYEHNPVYRQYITLLGKKAEEIDALESIPFLPIELFKNHEIKTGNWEKQIVFTSSGTSGKQTSRHFVRDITWYDKMALNGFEAHYGSVSDYSILALLPAYLERKGSSLVHMANQFIHLSKYDSSGFFLYDFEALSKQLKENIDQEIPTILLGVSFALLDLAEQFPMPLKDTIVMETGGMKGRRKELTREALQGELKAAFALENIHSEYGMTELLSQGYSKGNGLFVPISTMKILISEINDPFAMQKIEKSGLINVIDLANIDSCAFIATEDVGRNYKDGSFEVLGRLDYSALRGCNLMYLDAL